MDKFTEQLDKTLNTWGAPKEALAEIVSSYQNNEIGGASSGNTSTSTGGCECGDSVNLLQQQIAELTTQINTTTEKLNLLLNKLYDRSAIYNTNYDHIDTSVIFRTYDCYEKKKNLRTLSSVSTNAIGLFGLNGSETNLKLTAKIKGDAITTGSVALYLNGTLLGSKTYNITDTDEHEYSFEFTVSLLDTGNYIEALIKSANSIYINISYIKIEAYNCTNPTFIDIDSRYNMDYYNGNYYLSDCSGSTAKYAIVPANTMNSINDINWIDTGIEAISYRFIGNLIDSGGFYIHSDIVSNMYIQNNHSMYLNDLVNNKTYTEKTIYSDVVNPRIGEINLVSTFMSGRKIYTQHQIYKNGANKSYSNMSTTSKHCLVYAPKYQQDQYTSEIAKAMYLYHLPNNDIQFFHKNLYVNLGYGKYISSYILSSSPLVVEVYTKVHEYCIKHTINMKTTSSSATLNSYSSEVCGTYDHIFKGVKNDYFTVVDGVWHYYQSDLLESESI